jgi:hypothetical protein
LSSEDIKNTFKKLEEFEALDCIIRRALYSSIRLKVENRECFYKQSNWYGLATILIYSRDLWTSF